MTVQFALFRESGGFRLDRSTQQIQRLVHEESRQVNRTFGIANDSLHLVAFFSVDLDGEHANFDLPDWRVDLVDHGANFVDAFDRASQLNQAFADHTDRTLSDRIGRINVAGNVSIRICFCRRHFLAKLVSSLAFLDSLGVVPRVSLNEFRLPQASNRTPQIRHSRRKCVRIAVTI
ncbi:hypothetical protein [Rhodopirellula bahusiensis]|uniref:hypothetical protein n=1 Tax=Rhodopirellula bahusiensis TaxID=2014065 RepID=UPI0032648A2E